MASIQQIARLICFIGFLDLLAVSMILPLIASRTKQLGASSLLVGFIGSIYGGVQLFSSPIVGSWSDIKGRKFVLIISLVASSFGYFIMGYSSLLAVLIISRFIIGSFKHSQSISTAYLSNLVSPEERGVFYGYFTASSNIGFIVGPTFGGHLAELNNGFFWVTTTASMIFLINAVIVWQLLPNVLKESEKMRTRQEQNMSPKNGNVKSELVESRFSRAKRYFSQFQLKDCWDIMFLRLILGFSTLVYRSNFSLVLEESFGFTPKYVGYMTSYQGGVSTIAGFLVGHLTKLDPNENRQAFCGILSLTIALFGLTVAPGVIMLLVSLTVLSISTSFLRVCLNKVLASRCARDKVGAVFGLGQSVTSISRMLAPLAGGLALELGPHGPGLVGTIFSGVGLIVSLGLCSQTSQKRKSD